MRGSGAFWMAVYPLPCRESWTRVGFLTKAANPNNAAHTHTLILTLTLTLTRTQAAAAARAATAFPTLRRSSRTAIS